MVLRHILRFRGGVSSVCRSKGQSQFADVASISYNMALFDRNKNLFVGEELTKMYAQFRPTYSQKVYETIFKFCEENSPVGVKELAVDVGCGPGLSSLPLLEYFEQVVGVDVSEKQIANAPANVSNLSFHVSAAESLPFIKNQSVDLITVAQALHWIDLPKFYREVDRILKPGGSFVAYGYSTMEFEHKEIHDYLMHVYKNDLGSHWESGRILVENKYASISLPYEDWRRNDSLVMEKEWSVGEIVGYLSSWSAVHSYKKAHPELDLMADIQENLLKIASKDGSSGQEKLYKITWPVFMLTSRKPDS